MPDDQRQPQLWTISLRGGEPRQITHDAFPIASAFTWNHDGSQIAYIANGSVMAVEVDTKHTRRLTQSTPGLRPEACVFSPDGERIACVRQGDSDRGPHNQIFIAEV